jgi:mannosylfructose-phosphate synthase
MLSTHGYFDPIPQLGQTDTGGQVVYVLQLANALAKTGIKVDIYTRWFDRDRKQVDPVPGHPDVRVIRIHSGPWEFLPKEVIYDTLPELAKNMAEFIRDDNLDYDLFHGHYIDAGIVTLDIAGKFGKPAFFTAHSLGAWKREQMGGAPEEMDRKYNFTHRIAEELRIFKSVKAQTVTSAVQEEKLEELYGFTPKNVEVIPPGLDVERFRPSQPGEEKVTGEIPDRYIFCLSRIDTNKGHDMLLRAFDIVRKKIPDVQLVIGGGSPKPQKTEQEVFAMMKDIINRHDMGSRVRIYGYVPDEILVPLYRQAEIFALPSLFEPFGMTAQEAMACGTPVIASKLGGIREVITSGETGLLVDPRNADEFAEGIIRLLNDPGMLEDMGQRAYRHIHEHYSWDAIARRHIAFYNRYMD